MNNAPQEAISDAAKRVDERVRRRPAVEASGMNRQASQLYRDKYAEVMRDFRAGNLRGHSNQVVSARDEAKAMAASRAVNFEAGAQRKDPQLH